MLLAGAALVGRARQGLTLTRRRLTPAEFRGYARDPGGGLGAEPVAGEADRPQRHPAIAAVARLAESSRLYEFQTTMFQPVGGMGRIGEAFAREVGDLIRYNAKVDAGSSRTTRASPSPTRTRRIRRDAARRAPTGASAPFRSAILSQIPINVGRADEGGDRRRALRVVGQDRPAVQAPLLGGGRADLRRHQLHRPADPPDLLSQHRLSTRAARACCSAATLGTAPNAYEFTAMTPAERIERARGLRRADPSAISPRVRERRLGRLASLAVHAGLRRRLDRRGAQSSTTTISARSTAASCWPASMPPTFRPGRRARSCRRSTRSTACTSGCCRDEGDGARKGMLVLALLVGGRRRSPPTRSSAPDFASASRPARRSTPMSARPATWATARALSAPGGIRRWRRTRSWRRATMRLYVVLHGQRAMPPGRPADDRRAGRRRRHLHPHALRQRLQGAGDCRGRQEGALETSLLGARHSSAAHGLPAREHEKTRLWRGALPASAAAWSTSWMRR